MKKEKQQPDTAISVIQMWYDRHTGVMKIQSPGPTLAVGDVILTHNLTRFEIGEILDLRPAFGKYQDESKRPFVYEVKGSIIEKKRWEYNQDIKKNREIKKAENRTAKEEAKKEKHKPFSWSRTSTK
jgi:hypothetical protein